MFNNIQMLRAVAAAMVLFYHAAAQYEALHGASRWFIKFAGIGFSGVDIFFVISGFVAAHTTLDKPRTLSNAWAFARRRLLRIYLGYWPFFGLTLALTYIYFPAALAKLDLVSSFFLTSADLPRLLMYVTWSLTYELLFYAIVTASFALPVRIVKLVTHVWGVVILFILIWKPDITLSIFSCTLLEFLAGVMVYVHRDRLKSRWCLVPFALCAVVAFAIGARLHATDGAQRILAFGTGALALVLLAVTLEQSRTLIASRFWVALGDASYTLYLVHVSLFVLFYFWGIRDFLAGQPVVLRETGFFLYLALCLWISHVFYVRVEGPLYRWASSSAASGRPARAVMAKSIP